VEKRARAIVRAVTHYKDPKVLAEVSTNLGPAMVGISDIARDRVNFRDREGGSGLSHKDGHTVSIQRSVDAYMKGSSWEVDGTAPETKI
jgi:pyridoxal 5'-phosphate synthase pdxS subunit